MTRLRLCQMLSRVSTMLDKLGEGLAMILLGLICIVVFADVVMRNVFSDPLSGSRGFTINAGAAMIFLGLAPALRAGAHLQARTLPEHLPPMMATC